MGYDPEEDDGVWEEEPDPGGDVLPLLPLIDRDYFFDLLMEQQEQM